MHLPITFSVALLERTKMPHWYSTPSSNSVTLLTVIVEPMYSGTALVRLSITIWRIISTFEPFLSHPGDIEISSDCINTTHVNVALSPSHTVVSIGSSTTTKYTYKYNDNKTLAILKNEKTVNNLCCIQTSSRW